MLNGEDSLDFKKAVFITENAWYENKYSYNQYLSKISSMVEVCNALMNRRKLIYSYSDSLKVSQNAAIFTFLTDTTYYITDTSSVKGYLPYVYDFEDYNGQKDWTKMFVLKLLSTNKGNCHSLPYLYKILAEEMRTEAYLSFAPGHIYLKHRSKKTGWYNTELTSGDFPTDAWIMCSGYIRNEAIISGIYMDTLGLKQSVAYTLIDLAKGYERKFGIQDGSFILNCCQVALEHYPNCINALLLKAETMKKVFQIAARHPSDSISDIFYSKYFESMEKTYGKIVDLGYEEMPEIMYEQWLKSLSGAQEKYSNRKVPTYENRN